MLAGGLVALAVLSITACGGGEGGGTGTSPSEPADSNFPVTIEHIYGSTTIPSEPTRIVALGYEEDVLATMGITPVAYAENPARPDGDYPWLEGKIDLSDSTAIDVSGELNLEEMASLNPDLILAIDYYAIADYYEELSQIAPTLAGQQEPLLGTWQEVTTTVGRAVGREDDAAAAIAETEQFINSLAEELSGLQGKTMSSSYYYAAGEFAVIDDPEAASLRVYRELGLNLSPEIVETVVDRSISMEQVGLLDADVMFVGYASEELRKNLNENPLFQQIPAVQDGRVAYMDELAATAQNHPTVLNVPWQLQEFEPVLAKAASQG